MFGFQRLDVSVPDALAAMAVFDDSALKDAHELLERIVSRSTAPIPP
jgi:hypothetical protein